MTKECTKTACPYCGVGCGVEVNQLGITGDKSHPANQGALCVKGSALAESLDMLSRLLYPKVNGNETSWDAVTDLIANAYFEAIEHHGSDATAMYVSGQLLTEDYYLANKFMKGVVGSANIDTNSRLCMSSAVVAHNRAFGEDIVPINYSDIDDAELIIICGANTAWTHPVLYRRIQQAKLRNSKLKVVVIDPRETVTAQQADMHLAIPNDGDIALFNGLLRYCMDNVALSRDYIAQHTQGFEQLAQTVKSPDYSVAALSERLQLNQELLNQFYRWFATTNKTVTLFCQGVNQSQSGADKGNSIINAHLATGKIGYPGAGPFSITGQPNAMGGREVGGLANQLAVHRGFDADSIKKVSQFWQTERLATRPGLKAVEMFEAVERGDIKVIWIMATNPVVSMPDSHFIRQALEKCPLVIVSDITEDSDIAQYADVLLPAAGWGEKQGMVTNSERMLTRQRQFLQSKGEAKADWQAIRQVGEKLCALLGMKNGFDFDSEATVFREYAAMTGLNKESNLLLDLSQYADISDDEYHGWQPTQWGGKQPLANGQFSFPDRKARFIVPDDLHKSMNTSWWLNTGRQRDQWHTMTRTGHIPHLAASECEPTVYVNTQSALSLGLESNQLVEVRNLATTQRVIAKAVHDDALSRNQLFMSMHWAGKYGGDSQVNAVLSREADPLSGQPAFKSQQVELLPVSVKAYGLYIGKRFQQREFIYQSFQSEESAEVWRFADTQAITKQDVANIGDIYSQRRVLLDMDSGWLSVGYDEENGTNILRSILIVSSQPITSDLSQLANLIGQTLTFSSLLSIAAEYDASEMICSCFRVTDKQISAALESGECQSVSQLTKTLKCGSNCGSCLPQVERLVDSYNQTLIITK
ncbi:nitrate reductase [Vibrio ouci]|uniref:Nitrate reductase n=1 Tax=Vibrio ouci TaxID=2499078 RepID=A0A4Y8WJ43_9VIBR|nr:nitrate reductase [Vibrio ouci]TFH92635.1 nitrate reductase [Vibrio ouci]